MATDDGPAETEVTDRGMVTVPAEIRRRLDIDAGDKLRWVVDEGGLSVEVVHRREGAFDDLDAAPMGGDAVETHDSAGSGRTALENSAGDGGSVPEDG